MEDSQQLREQLWDLVYGLLSDEESEALIARVKSDPRAARLYSEVRLQAELVGQASRVVDRSVVLNADKLELAPAKGLPGSSGAPRRNGAWATMLATAALAAALLLGFVWPQMANRSSSQAFVATDIIASGEMSAGLTNKVTLRTYRLDSQPERNDGIATQIVVRLRGTEGKETFSQSIKTNDEGLATVELPGSALAPGARLEVDTAGAKYANGSTDHQGAADRATSEESKAKSGGLMAQLPIRPEPKLSYLLLGEPALGTNKPVDYSLWNFYAFSARPAPVTAESRTVRLAIGGEALAETEVPHEQSAGVITGKLQLPAIRAKQSLALAGRGELNKNSEEQLSPIVSPQSPARRTPPANAELAFNAPKPASVNMRQGQNQPAASPAPEQASKPLEEAAASKAEASLARTESALSTATAAADQGVPSLPATTSVPAGQPLPVAVPPELRDKPLVAAAVNNGITVATTSIDRKTIEGENRGAAKQQATPQESKGLVQLPLPPEIDGLIEVDLFDPTGQNREVVGRQFFTRLPQHKLNIAMPGAKDRYAPGDEAQITLHVLTETGQPAANTRLGVRVWNEQAIQQSGEQPLLLTDAVESGLIAGNEAVIDQLAQINPTLDLAKRTDKGEALERVRRLSEVQPAPVTLASNRDEVSAALHAARASEQAKSLERKRAVGLTAVIGGSALLLLLAVLLLLKMAGTARTWLPAVAVVAASGLVGAYWLDCLPQKRIDQLALATSNRESAPAAATAESAVLTTRDAKADLSSDPSPASSVAADKKMADSLAVAEKEKLNRDSTAGQTAVAGMAGGMPGAAAHTPAAGPLLAPAAPVGQIASRPESNADFDRAGGRAFGGGKSLAGGGGGSSQPPTFNRGLAADANLPAAAAGEPKDARASLPAGLYFNPALMTDAEGKATIRFTLPAERCEYRLLVDALGQGRIGSAQVPIVVGAGK